MSEFTIGDGAVIVAGAVVARDVTRYSVVRGISAKKLKRENDIKKNYNSKHFCFNKNWI